MITVLVTGCGGAVGLGASKALRMSTNRFRLVGVDADPYAASFHFKKNESLLDKTYVVSRADHPDYIREISDICRREKVDVIFPATDAELERLAILKDEIGKIGTKIVISPRETIRICRDKWLTYQNLSRHLPIVKSALPNLGLSQALRVTGLPAMIKPRLGWGSRETYKVRSVEEAEMIIGNIEKPIIQSWLEGEEYTVDGLTDKHGKVLCCVPRRRTKVLAGLSFQGITVRDEQLIRLGEKIAEHLKIVGPFNFQLKKIDGEPEIFEINPRFAGTGILSVEAGVNIPLLAVKTICDMKIPGEIDFEEGMVVSRYFKEVFFKSGATNANEN
jgi:carbamoyl-phosphate synthase large subunit